MSWITLATGVDENECQISCQSCCADLRKGEDVYYDEDTDEYYCAECADELYPEEPRPEEI